MLHEYALQGGRLDGLRLRRADRARGAEPRPAHLRLSGAVRSRRPPFLRRHRHPCGGRGRAQDRSGPDSPPRTGGSHSGAHLPLSASWNRREDRALADVDMDVRSGSIRARGTRRGQPGHGHRGRPADDRYRCARLEPPLLAGARLFPGRRQRYPGADVSEDDSTSIGATSPSSRARKRARSTARRLPTCTVSTAITKRSASRRN